MNTETTLDISDSAAERIKFLLSKEGKEGLDLRVAVDGGGCSGFQYNIDFDNSRSDDDNIIEKDGITVLVDNVSMEMLAGSVLDYVETLGAAHFQIKNPQATATCGCGNSFSI